MIFFANFLLKSLRKSKIFERKNEFSFFIFQIGITSSDLNEFWIGQKFWKALDLLFHLSTTFMGFFRKYRVAKWG